VKDTTLVPAAPFVGLINTKMEEIAATGDGRPSLLIANELDIEERRIYEIRKSDHITFALADRIVCKLSDEVMPWHDGGEFEELYDSVDLARLDLLQPIDRPGPRQAAKDRLYAAWEAAGRNRLNAATSLGISTTPFGRLLKEFLTEDGRSDELSLKASPSHCVNGHDKDVEGRDSSGYCLRCKRAKNLRNNRIARERRAAARAAA
jgi:hypothetical protein